MSDPSKPAFHQIPEPAVAFARENTTSPTGRRSIADIAKRWLPKNVSIETLIATVARNALRLIDRGTGEAYSADELQAKILAAFSLPAHTHASADVTDASTGGNSTSDNGKVVKFDNLGGLLCSTRLRIHDPSAGPPRTLLLEFATGLTGDHSQKFPDKTGVIGIFPSFLDSSAANAVVSVGDVWWDLTLNKARVRLA